MSFHDVPLNVSERSLDDDKVLAANVVDLCCPDDARRSGALTILICDGHGRLLQPIVVDGPPREMAAREVALIFENIIEIAGAGSSTILAICRPDGRITDVDRRWHQLVIDRCRASEVRLIGTYVATPNEVIELPTPMSA